MLLNLKVLRGVDLLALDENYLTESSSDPYCQIFVNGHKVGWTPVRNATLDPVWGDDMSSFEIQGGGGTRVTIKIFDYDGALSDDDYMGQVTFYAQDFLDRTSDTYPNIWATIEPPEGRDYAGKLQLRIAAPADEAKKKSRLMRSLALSRKKPPLKLSAGPSLSPEIKSCLHKHLFFAKAPVILHVYDVGKDSRIHALNQVLPATGAGGIFHGAIEVHGREYSFGYAPRERPGVFACQPQSCPMHTFRESIFLGDCQLTPSQVQAILRQLKPEWMANTYNLLQKNCCTFSNEFAIELGVGPIPEWVHALAHTAVALNEVLGRQERLEERHLRTTWRQLPVEEEDHCSASLPNLVLAHVMARRLQRAFWARKAQRVARGGKSEMCVVFQHYFTSCNPCVLTIACLRKQRYQ